MCRKVNSKSGSLQRPSAPAFALKKLIIQIAASDMVIGNMVFDAGFTFHTEFILFGITIKAKLSVSYLGFHAHFSTTRIQFLSTLRLCKNRACKREEGPMMDIKMKVLPPMFRIEAAFFADILGFKFGASLTILWKNIVDFEASFTAEPVRNLLAFVSSMWFSSHSLLQLFFPDDFCWRRIEPQKA